MVSDYTSVDGSEMSKDLQDSLNRSVEYLNRCRPISTSMHSVVKYINPFIQACRRIADTKQVTFQVAVFTVSFLVSNDGKLKPFSSCDFEVTIKYTQGETYDHVTVSLEF